MADASSPGTFRIPGPQLVGWAEAGTGSLFSGDKTGLRLAFDPTGPLRLDAADGSLGRLTFPRGVAVDDDLIVYLLDRQRGLILRHDPGTAKYDPKTPFVVIPGVGNHELSQGSRNPRWFAAATAIAVRGNTLYVADGGSRRVLAFDRNSWTLQDVWLWVAPECPQDVVTYRDVLYVLTTAGIYRHRPGDSRPCRFDTGDRHEPARRRMAVDRDGLLYVLAAGATDLLVFDPQRGTQISNAPTVRDRFPLPAIYTFPDESSDQQFVMPEPLTRQCGREWPSLPMGRPIETYFTRRPGPTNDGFVFDQHGARIPIEKVRPSRTRLFYTGTAKKSTEWGEPWISQPLDSKLYDCRWDVIALTFADLPPGSVAEVSTYSANDNRVNVPDEAWATGLTVTGPPRAPESNPEVTTDFLVDSPPGRYLWLRIRFRGDGFTTPVLTQVAARFPRRSYLEHLPAVFSEDEAGRRFLERFLAVFQAEWDQLEHKVADLAGLFDPKAVKAVAETHIDYLAGWLGVQFENGLDADARQRLLARLPAAFFAPRTDDNNSPRGTRRGTPAAVQEYVAAVIAAVAEVEPNADGFPFIIDGYRDREYRLLPCDDGTSLPTVPDDAEMALDDDPLWGPGQIGRFQLGVASRLDEALLLPPGSPDLDVFAAHAHRFRVVVPAVWVATPAAAAAVRRAIESEKPAHTAYELQVVKPGLRLGVQSTVGVDTIIGGEDARLTVAGLRLGTDATLPLSDGPAMARLDAGVRLGTDPTRI